MKSLSLSTLYQTAFALALLLPTLTSAVDYRYTEFEILRLPEWQVMKDLEKKSYIPGGGLWPSDLLPEKGTAYIEKADEAFRYARINWPVGKKSPNVQYLKPEEKTELPDLPVNEEAVGQSLSGMDTELVKTFFDQKPEYMLHDPQELINPQRINDILRFLEYHADESRFEIQVLVLGGKQFTPAAIDMNQIHQQWFGEKHGVIMVYHYDSPDQTELHFGEDLESSIPSSILNLVKTNSIAQGKPAEKMTDQLEKIAIELSIQLFGLENYLDRPSKPSIGQTLPEVTGTLEATAPVDEEKLIESPTDLAAAHKPIETIAFEKDARISQIEAISTLGTQSMKTQFTGRNGIRLIVSLSLICLLGLGGGRLFKFLATKRANSEQTILFPSYTPQPRLGGKHSGGTFVGLSYDSTK